MFGTMGTTSPELGREELGGLRRVDPLSLEARARRPIIEAVWKINCDVPPLRKDG
jgi:hypothetical protein